jgi:hypothetical protein
MNYGLNSSRMVEKLVDFHTLVWGRDNIEQIKPRALMNSWPIYVAHMYKRKWSKTS